jgi:hypothetical protein
LLEDHIEQIVEVLINLFVRDPDDPPSSCPQISIAFAVIGYFLAAIVGHAVDFKNELRSDTGKIRDKRSYRVLPPENPAMPCAQAKTRPEDGFRIRHSAAEDFGKSA